VAAVRPPGRSLRSAIQHFAAGVVFSVVAVELLPDITRVHDLFEVGWTFAAGVLVMLGIERLGRKLGGEEADDGAGAHGAAGLGAGQGIAIGIDILLDGLLVGIAFAAGLKEGRLLVLALSLELLSLGLSVASTLVAKGAGRVRTVVVPTALASLLLVGAVAGETVLANASEHTLAGVLSFGCAALLYLVTEELLVEAHETADTTFATSMFFAGFLLFMLLGMVE
jgi:ZIP family zinc transporter